MNDEPYLITEAHLRTLLDNVSHSTINRWEKAGLPVKKIGGLKRYDYHAVLSWIEKMAQTGGD